MQPAAGGGLGTFLMILSLNFSLFLSGLTGESPLPGQRALCHWDERSITSVSAFLRLPSQQARWHVAEKWLHDLLFIWLSQLTKWCAWLSYLPGHLRHRLSGRPCWPVNIRRGWWRYAGIWWRQPARRSCPSRWALVRNARELMTRVLFKTQKKQQKKTPQIYQKYTRKFSPVDLNSLGEAKGCSISQRNHSASYGPLFFLCHVFAPVSTEEIWTTCWLCDTHKYTHRHAQTQNTHAESFCLLIKRNRGAMKDKNMCRHAQIKSVHAQKHTAPFNPLLHPHG